MRRTETSGHFYFRFQNFADRAKDTGLPRLHPFGVMAMKVVEGGVRISTALCHPVDEFRKKKGCELAYNRLNWETQFIFIPTGETMSFVDIMNERHPANSPFGVDDWIDTESHEKHFMNLFRSLTEPELNFSRAKTVEINTI